MKNNKVTMMRIFMVIVICGISSIIYTMNPPMNTALGHIRNGRVEAFHRLINGYKFTPEQLTTLYNESWAIRDRLSIDYRARECDERITSGLACLCMGAAACMISPASTLTPDNLLLANQIKLAIGVICCLVGSQRCLKKTETPDSFFKERKQQQTIQNVLRQKEKANSLRPVEMDYPAPQGPRRNVRLRNPE